MTNQYNKEEIAALLERFMAGESTLAEEQLLADYFRTHEVADEWREYKEMFALFDNGKVDVEPASSGRRTDSSSINHHSSIIIRLAAVSIAAAVVITFLLWPKGNGPLPTSPKGEEYDHLRERAEAEATTQQPMEVATVQPQQEASSKVLTEQKGKKTIPKPIVKPQHEEVPDEPQTMEETEEPIDLYEASYRPPMEEMMTVEELHARGNRLTENIRQQLQANNVPY
ncbi:MAG: hypothetical protein K6A32_06915 [Bacteroidales bacterium]|nr:hypothetical protein [Bacteroidales bacterium]